jgi:lauroyl/myristoyl acyltransferase
MTSPKKLSFGALRLADLGLLLAYGVCRLLPVAWVSAFGAWRGRYRGAQLIELENRVRQNLAEIAPEADAASVLAGLRAESGRALLEVLIADRLAWSCRLQLAPCPAFEAVIHSNRSVVFALIHQSNLGDVAGAAIVQATPHVIKRFFVTRDIHNRTMKWMVHRTREQSMRGMKGLISGPVRGLTRQMLHTLTSETPSIAVLHVDEARNHQVLFPGFGREVPCKGLNASYAIRLARHTGACLVPVSLSREADCPTRFYLKTLSVWDLASDTRDDLTVLKDMSKLFEAEILKDPSKWLNIYHRRPATDSNILELRDEQP